MSELPPPTPPAPPATDDPAGEDGADHHVLARRHLDGRSTVGRVAVAPDGSRVAFVVATIDVAANTTRTCIWLDDAPATAGEHDGDPAWSPDGRFLAFTSRRGERATDSTLHVLPVGAPGEVRTVCSMAGGIGDVAWSPDGRWLAFTSRVPDPAADVADASWAPPRKVERFFSRLNGLGWIFDRPSHVHVVAADGSGPPRDLTPDGGDHAGASWLRDGSGIVTTVARPDEWNTDLAVVAFDPFDDGIADDRTGVADADGRSDTGRDGDGRVGARVRRLTDGTGSYSFPVVSPDGSMVAFVGTDDTSVQPKNRHVGVLALTQDPAGLGPDPVAEVRWVSTGLDRSFVSLLAPIAPVWESDVRLLAVAEDRGTAHVYGLDVRGSRPKPVTAGALSVTALDAAGGTMATGRTTVDRPAELFVGDERVTDLSGRLAARSLGWEHFTAPCADGGGEIDVWIMRPAGFDPERRYPVLLNVHGGPFAQYGEMYFDEFQIQAAAGFVVVAGNPRGSSGRHEGWGQAITGPQHPTTPGSGWATVDVDDVLSIVDTALEQFAFCDPDRVGMLGGSYGGYMATWLAGHHGDRFRAFCSERAVNDLTSLEWSSDVATFFQAAHGVSYLEAPDEYEQRSPIRAVRRIDRPMLIIHAEEDWRCPINQAEQLWMALRLLGKEVDFYRFPAENHDMSRSGSPVHRVQRAEIVLDWFADKLT